MTEFPKKVDIHELMKKEMKSMNWDVSTEVHNSRSYGPRTTPPKSSEIGFSDVYLYCDSFNKESSSDPNDGLFIFDVLKLNSLKPINNFIEAEVYMPFFIPQPPVDTTYQPEFYYFRHIQMAIDPITKTQQVRGEHTFHFDLELDHAGGSTFRAMYGMTKYIFSIPLTDIRELHIRFSAPPNKNISLYDDQYDAAIILSGGPDPLNRRMKTSTPHNLTIGTQYSIFATGFNSTNAPLNAVINDTRGHLVNVIDSTTIEFTTTPTATSIGTAVDSLGNPATCKIFIGERRLAFILRFRELKDTHTNFIKL